MTADEANNVSPAIIILLLMAAGAAVRIACFPFTWEQGDAPARIALALRWLHNPGIMSCKDCVTNGPASILLNAIALSIWDAPYTAPRLVSLLFGIVTVVPLFSLTRLLFDPRGKAAAIFTCLFFAFYSLHVRASGTAMAETPFWFFFLTCLFFFFRYRRDRTASDLRLAAVMLSIASMIRYEGWLYIPILGILALRPGAQAGARRERLMGLLKPAAAFVLIASVLPVVWMAVNYAQLGDPLWNWHNMADQNAQVTVMAVAQRGVAFTLVYNAFFAPGVLFLSLTPAVAVLAVFGLVKAVARGQALAYAVLLIPFAVYPALMITMLMVPQSRYFGLPGLLLLPYAGAQMDGWTSGLSRDRVWRTSAAVLASAAVVLAGLFAAAYLPNLPFHQKFWSVAPVSPFMSEPRQVYDLLKARMKPGDKIIQDGNTFYTHFVVFNVSPDIYEDWWGRPVLSIFKTPELRRRFLESSAPGFVLLEKDKPDLPALLDLSPKRMADLLKVRLRLIHSGPRYTLYELSPKGPG